MSEGVILLLAILGVVVIVGVVYAISFFIGGGKKRMLVNKEMMAIEDLLNKENENIDEILMHLDNVLEIDPRNIDALNGKAKFCYLKYSQNGNKELYRQSLSYYERSLVLSPDNPYTLVSQALVMTNPEDIDKALDCYDRATELYPDFFEAWHSKAKTLAVLGPDYFERAKECYTHILNNFGLTSGKEVILYEKIKSELENLSYTGQGLNDTIKDIDELREIINGDGEIFFLKGLAYYYSGEQYFAQAMDFYNRAIEEEPDVDMAYINKGVLLMDMNRYDEALTCLDKAIELDSENALSWYNAGVIYKELGDEAKSVACYDRASELDPEFDKSDKEIQVAGKIWEDDPYK